jgi:hypothetical protein
VELLIGLDNRQWLPVHMEDSWDPDDDMRLLKSVFGYRFMITDGWGRDLTFFIKIEAENSYLPYCNVKVCLPLFLRVRANIPLI